MNRLTDHLIVISFDCLSALDFPMLKELPHFSELLLNGAYCKNVESIYPSVTYPCHATIVTGNYPHRHGVVNNTYLQPGRLSPDWHWHRHHIKGTTLYDEAKKAGMRTGALLWPVTAKAEIDYNMPEIFANRPWHHQIPVSLFNGSIAYQLEMHRRFGSIRNGLNQPELDDFVLESAVHTIQAKKPHLLLVHFTDLDTQRHYHGFSSEQAMAALRRHDARLGRMVKALKEIGIYSQSTIVALGDHSALDHSVAIQPNNYFKEKGLITVDRRGKVTHWKAYCHSCDGSAYIYIRDKNDRDTKHFIQEWLQELLHDGRNGIEQVLTGDEAGARGADARCDFMLEARRGFYFKESLYGGFLHQITAEDVKAKRYTWGSHGYSPEKENYCTFFAAAGKGIIQQAIPSMRLIDEGPTFARLLGLHLGNTDGTVVEGLLAV
ncbi:alkaline phosphatase family protein [Fictibacillus terranigra]|uniref:Ectonucleotide pyrophosphatase/phosphodiesterase n=1 Tax=Fictibacillus terranigra TaxID=3058424 RepID=A0ABT8E3H8_9BACL|nr:ectonucleotide pyrophosphatase/phosphodiesterase [Fictibacillus sp. CENA-BCM004]MDN4072459.1 ectonucleotide pyrophosphatase/phosphodiesterase [Fictibacillus sp. CENA-BCM004]